MVICSERTTPVRTSYAPRGCGPARLRVCGFARALAWDWMTTLEQVAQELQARLIGSWHGRARLWFEPGDPTYDEKVEGDVAAIAAGRWVRHEYSTVIDGRRRARQRLDRLRRRQAHLADRVGRQLPHLFRRRHAERGADRPRSMLAVDALGSYEGGDGPRWGWRTEYEPADDGLVVRHFNVSPAGEESPRRAVRLRAPIAMPDHQIRLAGVDDAPDVARLLHDFNTEFDDPTPGVADLTVRMRRAARRGRGDGAARRRDARRDRCAALSTFALGRLDRCLSRGALRRAPASRPRARPGRARCGAERSPVTVAPIASSSEPTRTTPWPGLCTRAPGSPTSTTESRCSTTSASSESARRDADQASALASITESTLPAGSLNQAISGPPPRNTPFSSVSVSVPS